MDPSKINFQVLRNRNGRLGVYKKYRKSGREVSTEVRNVRGDVDQFRRMLLHVVESPVHVCVGKVEVQCIHTWKVIEWLRSLGM